MSTRLEQFINEHRDEFDDEMPDSKTWENIKQGIETPGKKRPVFQIPRIRWAVAAAVLVLFGSGVLYLLNKSGEPKPSLVDVTKKAAPGNNLPKIQPAGVDTGSARLAQSSIEPKKEIAKEEPAADDPVSDYKEEMYHFAKLVEIRHKELSKIVKDEPLLYRQFNADVNKLDSVYRILEKQLPQNPNREQLIEAMIQNLQLQMDLLNHQLTIVKQINHSKKSAYEKAFKSA